MRKNLGILFALFVVVVSIISSCTKSSPLGSELLVGDQANIQFTDTFSLRMATIEEEKVLAFDPNDAFDFFLLGDYEDAVFGQTTASIYAQMKPSIAFPNELADTTELDSIVLSLVYDQIGFYGITDEPQTISIHRLTEDMNNEEIYYSDQQFAFDMTPMVTSTFTPSFDSVSLESYFIDDTSFLSAPQLRIALDNELGEEILSKIKEITADSTLTNSQEDSVFVDYFKGLHIKMETPNKGIMSFSLSSGISAIALYYKEIEDGDSDKNILSLSFNGTLNSDPLAKITHIQHNYPEAITTAFDDFDKGAETLYLQGLSGPNVEMIIPEIHQLKNTIINKAELEFTINVEDTIDYESPIIIAVATRDSDGDYFLAKDLVFAQSASLSVFGGFVENIEGESRQVYRMNIAGVLQDLLQESSVEPLYLRVLSKQEQARRVTLFGPGSPQHPTKLNVTYTRLN